MGKLNGRNLAGFPVIARQKLFFTKASVNPGEWVVYLIDQKTWIIPHFKPTSNSFPPVITGHEACRAAGLNICLSPVESSLLSFTFSIQTSDSSAVSWQQCKYTIQRFQTHMAPHMNKHNFIKLGSVQSADTSEYIWEHRDR